MGAITIQQDVDPTDPWLSELLNIGKAWESFALSMNLDISGLLTPYGLECTVHGKTVEFINLNVQLEIKLQNIVTNVLPLNSPVSSVLMLKGLVAGTRKRAGLRVESKTFIGVFRAMLHGLHKVHESDKHNFYSRDKKLLIDLSFKDFDLLEGLQYLQLKNQHIKIRSLHVPDEHTKIEQWFKSLASITK